MEIKTSCLLLFLSYEVLSINKCICKSYSTCNVSLFYSFLLCFLLAGNILIYSVFLRWKPEFNSGHFSSVPTSCTSSHDLLKCSLSTSSPVPWTCIWPSSSLVWIFAIAFQTISPPPAWLLPHQFAVILPGSLHYPYLFTPCSLLWLLIICLTLDQHLKPFTLLPSSPSHPLTSTTIHPPAISFCVFVSQLTAQNALQNPE